MFAAGRQKSHDRPSHDFARRQIAACCKRLKVGFFYSKARNATRLEAAVQA
jgi:hypothetical protein